MTDYDRKLEKEYRDGMVINAIYDFVGNGTGGWKRGYRLASFIGAGENLQLVFEDLDTGDAFYIHACDMGGFSLISKPKQSSEPMNLVKKSEGYRFDEVAFYRATNSVRHFLIKDSDNNRYEAFYYGPTLDGGGMHIAFARIVGCGNVTCESAELYHDKIKCDPVWTNFKLFKGDSICTYNEIKIDNIFKREEKLEWDIDKLKVGKAYRIRDIDGNETNGIYRFLYEPTIPGQSSIVFAVVSDKGAVGTHHVYLEELASGKIEIYELAVKKGCDE